MCECVFMCMCVYVYMCAVGGEVEEKKVGCDLVYAFISA